MDDDAVEARIERFATARFPLVVHVGVLLGVDRFRAEEHAIEAIRGAVAAASASSDDDALLRAVLGRMLRECSSDGRGRSRGGIELHDVRGAGSGPTGGAAHQRVALRDALGSLTFRERSAVVLHLGAGLGLGQSARAMRWPRVAVRRELDRAMDYLATEADVSRTDVADIARRAFRPDVTEYDVPALVRRLQASIASTPPRQLRKGRALLVGGVAVAMAAAIGGLQLTMADDERHTDDSAADADLTDGGSADPGRRPDAPRVAEALPAPAKGWKWVGYQDLMLTVPSGWEQTPAPCAEIVDRTVVYPEIDADFPCVRSSTRGRSVAFGPSGSRDRVAFDKVVALEDGQQVTVTPILLRVGHYIQYAAFGDSDVIVGVRSPRRSQIDTIVRSIRAVPSAYVVIPNTLGLEPTEAYDVLAAAGLDARMFADPSAHTSGIPLRVVRETPAVGSLIPFDSTVNLGVIPR